MNSISLNEAGSMEIGSSADWLGVDKEVQACTITADMDKNQPNEQDNDNQEDSDLLPFDPDYQEAEAQKLISNLPKLNDCEFDYNYILHHLEQLELDPSLCSKCSTANKYFAAPEPFVQDLYKKSCYWKQTRDTSCNMEILR